MSETNLIAEGEKYLTKRKVELLKLIHEHSPCSMPGLIGYLISNKSEINRPDHFNKLTKDLRDSGYIEVVSKECSLLGKVKRKIQVYELAKSLPIQARKKVTKTTEEILYSSLESALLAVESYNKPNTLFKTENFIILMINAWLKLSHAYLNHKNIDFKEGKIDNQLKGRKTISFQESLNKLLNENAISNLTKANLEFCLKLRDQIEHSYIRDKYFDSKYWAKYQLMINDYVKFFEFNFSEKYLKDLRLNFALQLSPHIMSEEQEKLFIKDMTKDVKSFLKLMSNYEAKHIVKNLSKEDLACYPLQVNAYINIVNRASDADIILNNLQSGISEAEGNKLVAVLKSNREGLPPKRFIEEKVNLKLDVNRRLQHSDLHPISRALEIKPKEKKSSHSVKKFCFWDDCSSQYLYTDEYANYLVNILINDLITIEELKKKFSEGKTVNYKEFEINK